MLGALHWYSKHCVFGIDGIRVTTYGFICGQAENRAINNRNYPMKDAIKDFALAVVIGLTFAAFALAYFDVLTY